MKKRKKKGKASRWSCSRLLVKGRVFSCLVWKTYLTFSVGLKLERRTKSRKAGDHHPSRFSSWSLQDPPQPLGAFVFVSFCCCNRRPQTQWLYSSTAVSSNSSADQTRILPGCKQGVSKPVFLLETLGENSFSYLFLLPEAAQFGKHIWLSQLVLNWIGEQKVGKLGTFLHQQALSSIFRAKNITSLCLSFTGQVSDSPFLSLLI